MTILEANAWQWWLALSPADYKDGLIYTDFQKPGDEETVYPSKTLWCLGNFSRFIRPGYRRVWSVLPNEAVEGLHGSAYISPKGDQLVVVLVNCGSEAEAIALGVTGGRLQTAIPYITSDRAGDDLRKMSAVDLNKAFSVPSRSVVTLVARLNPGKG
jgi:O-glycosyl hydrolase